MLAKVRSGAVMGIDAYVVEVEVDIAHGLPSFTTVGLPEVAVKESRERVKAAITNSGYSFPGDRITVNLAPANLRKEGTAFDLPLALGILAATDVVPKDRVASYLFIGELSLDGRIKSVTGTLPIALTAQQEGCKAIVVPAANAPEAAVVPQLPVLAADHLSQVVSFLREEGPLPKHVVDVKTLFEHSNTARPLDFADVMGQESAKRALEVAAAGGHNVLMMGPPGSGKTLLARMLPSILPALTFNEAIETTKIYSVAGLLKSQQALVTQRPFRSPHHTISDAGLIGGGHIPRPGEVSLSQNGVLFLDELPEYKKHVLEVLRQPMEDQHVTIARAATSITYPARFMLVAAMNPCPCGHLTDTKHACRCLPGHVQRYRNRISGPLMDRIDLQVDVPAVPTEQLGTVSSAESSTSIRERVVAARKRQAQRFKGGQVYANAQMNTRDVQRHCKLDEGSQKMLHSAVDRLGLSARAYHRILKIARTIADLDGGGPILKDHLFEAIQYRSFDRMDPHA